MPPRLVLPIAACVGRSPRQVALLPLSVRALHSLSRPAAAAPALRLTRHLASHTDDPKYQPGAGSRGRPAESTSELLERLEAEARRRAAAADATRDHAGPFPLGPRGSSAPWKAWSELGVRGKIGRAFRQSGNLAIILLGGGLFVVLTLALTTELFAKNSPSVLYSQCIDMIRDSDALNGYLLPPLSYTHSPHSSAPTRGSAPVVHTAVRHPISGRDHLLITFWVHGRGLNEPERLSWAKEWWAKFQHWAQQGGHLLGIASEPVEPATDIVAPVDTAEGKKDSSPGLLGRFASSLSLRGVASAVSSVTKSEPPGTYKIGEVRADYVKNAAGHFTLLALVVDVPSRQAPHPGRATVYWSPEADREGLISRHR
ncbi:hypothetical protein VHUM_00105 [Vanrija humicola]|uniref:Mitochondrial import inner membrane translocase subunit Tim21 n=1 Tax=Vanrija humicola TaxID=5417 RepID=A0A7D8Z6S9_VANHU|nr:hypothetical protein VHUM_00105 [Vanrija humicola]